MVDHLINIRKLAAQASADFQLLEPNDRILVAVSGGKDSSVMLKVLTELQLRSPFEFHVQPLIVDQKQPGFQVDAFRTWVASLGVELIVLEEDTYSVVKEKTAPGKAYCGLCSRLRRGILYTYAQEHGYNKIALGHHLDDAVETLFMNISFTGKIAAMPPSWTTHDGLNQVIRPLCLAKESDIAAASLELKCPVIPCSLCGQQTGLQRQATKQLIQTMQTQNPRFYESCRSALGNVKSSHLYLSDLQS